MRFLLILTGLALTLSACAKPVTVMNGSGSVMQGSYTASFTGGTFQVCRGKLVCTGAYSLDNTGSPDLYFPVFCNNGLKGNATATLLPDGNGHGTVTFSDGTTLDFLFGKIASTLQPR